MPRYDTHWQSRGKKKRAAQVRWARLLVVPAVVLGMTLLGWTIIRSPLFRVTSVEVAGTAHVAEDQVIDAAQGAETGFLRRMVTRASLLGWPSALPQASVALVPGAKSITVDRRFFSGNVMLTVVERDPVGVWCFEAAASPVCQWFDEEGVVYGRAYVSQGSLVPVVHDRSQERAGEGRRVLPPEQLRHFTSIIALLKAHGVSPREMTVSSGGKQEVAMTTYNGPQLYFTLRNAPDQAPAVLADFIKKGALSSLHYIDFRSPKRAFYQ